MRYRAAVRVKSAADSRVVARPMKAVLHDSAKACRKSLMGAVPSALWKASPSTVTLAGHLAAEDGCRPRSINAVDVMILNDEPGGNAPSMARLKPPDTGTLTDARTWPVSAFTATMAAFFFTVANARSAAAWTRGSMLVWTLLPGVGLTRAMVATDVPSALTTVTTAPGLPASCRSYSSSSPVWPTTLAALYGAPRLFSSSAVIGPTVPTV